MKANVDWDKTFNRLRYLKSRIGFSFRRGGREESLIIIWKIKDLEDLTIMISRYGKIQIFCPSGDQVGQAWAFLKRVLIPIYGEELIMEPYNIHVRTYV